MSLSGRFKLNRAFVILFRNYSTNFNDVRQPYQDRDHLFLEEKIEIKEPISLLDKWFQEAKNHPHIYEPHAVCLSTATKDGLPSARLVLCKKHSKEGFVIFTHYTSRKGQELEENPNAALTYYWPPFNRQVRVEGKAQKMTFEEADEYFNKRPFNSRIGALCSDQSKVIENRYVLTRKEKELKEKHSDGNVPRPPLWGGYLIIPHSIEFWQGQTDRIHDRILFRKLKEGEKIDEKCTHKGEDGWYYERLAP